METKSQIVRIAFWVLLGIVILASSLALNRPLPRTQDATITSATQIGTITPEMEAREDVGSTDGIMIMALAIVLIIIIPILIRRDIWSNGKSGK